MNIRIIGGGPAGLFFAYLMKRDDASHDIRVFERDPEDATYGWGVVFSDVALAFVRDIAPELYASMTEGQEVFSEMMAVVHRNVPALLADFVRRRQPGSDALQQAAIKSTEWYENLGPKLALDPVSFAYDYLTRSGRVSHADVRARDPALAAAYEKLHPGREF